MLSGFEPYKDDLEDVCSCTFCIVFPLSDSFSYFCKSSQVVYLVRQLFESRLPDCVYLFYLYIICCIFSGFLQIINRRERLDLRQLVFHEATSTVSITFDQVSVERNFSPQYLRYVDETNTRDETEETGRRKM